MSQAIVRSEAMNIVTPRALAYMRLTNIFVTVALGIIVYWLALGQESYPRQIVPVLDIGVFAAGLEQPGASVSGSFSRLVLLFRTYNRRIRSRRVFCDARRFFDFFDVRHAVRHDIG